MGEIEIKSELEQIMHDEVNQLIDLHLNDREDL